MHNEVLDYFPFHIVVDESGQLLQLGTLLYDVFGFNVVGNEFSKHFEFAKPSIDLVKAKPSSDYIKTRIRTKTSPELVLVGAWFFCGVDHRFLGWPDYQSVSLLRQFNIHTKRFPAFSQLGDALVANQLLKITEIDSFDLVSQLYKRNEDLQKSIVQLNSAYTKVNSVFEKVHTAIFVVDKFGAIGNSNAAAKELLHKLNFSLNGINFYESFPELINFNINQNIESNGLISFEKQGLDENLLYLQVSADVVHDEDGIKTLFFVRDYTDLVQFHEAEKIAAAAFDSLDSIVILNAELELVAANSSFETLTGFQKPDWNNKTISQIFQEYGLESELTYQLELARNIDKKIRGESIFIRNGGATFPVEFSISIAKNEFGQILRYALVLRDITSLRETNKLLRDLAYQDSLTGVGNRLSIHDGITRAFSRSKRNRKSFAVLLLDFDGFKKINDAYGHAVGDEYLIKAAKKIKNAVRDIDVVGRLGGDEFAVIIEDLQPHSLKSLHSSEIIGKKILDEFSSSIDILGVNFICTVSIGIAIYSHDDELSINDFLARADSALYAAKEAGKNCLRFFDSKIRDELLFHHQMENLARYALRENQIKLALQPQFSDAGDCVGVEALIRLTDQAGNSISPLKLIDTCERCGIICELDMWVLKQCCMILNSWSTDPSLSSTSISVNVSGITFGGARYVEELLETANQFNINRSLLKIELTESSVVTNIEESIAKMKLLGQLGFTVSMDDFGTGVSSLSYLKNLPFNQVKIDRSFVNSMSTSPVDKAIVEMVIFVGKFLGVNVIAEGVELQSEIDMLLNLGCSSFQGYFFSKPLPIEQCEAFIRERASMRDYELNSDISSSALHQSLLN